MTKENGNGDSDTEKTPQSPADLTPKQRQIFRDLPPEQIQGILDQFNPSPEAQKRAARREIKKTLRRLSGLQQRPKNKSKKGDKPNGK